MDSAYPLATNARHRLFAWPRYGDDADLGALARVFGPILAGRNDVCLCLRHDPDRDGPLEAAKALVAATFERLLSHDATIDVLFVDGRLDERAWGALGQSVTALLVLPSSGDPDRLGLLTLLRALPLAKREELAAVLAGPAPPEERAPKVSAIVSTYKSAVFMQGCLDDLVGQTLFARGELEIVVVDSGSPEHEGAIVAGMQARHPGIRYVRTERETLYAAWNRGVRLARGQYLTNANTDDRHRPDALERMAAHLDARPDVSLVYADCLVTQTPNEAYGSHHAVGALRWPDYSYRLLLDRCFIGPQPMWRRSLHDRHGYFDESFIVAGDYEFWLRIGQHERVEHIPELLGLYYQNAGGLEHGSGRTEAETIEVRRRYAHLAAAPAAPARSPQVTALVSEVKALVAAGQLDGATARLGAALPLAAEAPELVLMLATVFMAQGKRDAACQTLEHGATMHPGHAGIARELARVAAR